jgi:four helix bundle protein
MKQSTQTSSGRPFNLHERLLLYACDVVRAVEFLHKRGPIGRALSYQILSAGTSVGSNYEESDGASSTADFIAKNRIALKEAKEVRFRLRVCRLTDLLDAKFDPLLRESDEIVRILGKIVHNALRRQANENVDDTHRTRL